MSHCCVNMLMSLFSVLLRSWSEPFFLMCCVFLFVCELLLMAVPFVFRWLCRADDNEHIVGAWWKYPHSTMAKVAHTTLCLFCFVLYICVIPHTHKNVLVGQHGETSPIATKHAYTEHENIILLLFNFASDDFLVRNRLHYKLCSDSSFVNIKDNIVHIVYLHCAAIRLCRPPDERWPDNRNTHRCPRVSIPAPAMCPDVRWFRERLQRWHNIPFPHRWCHQNEGFNKKNTLTLNVQTPSVLQCVALPGMIVRPTRKVTCRIRTTENYWQRTGGNISIAGRL